MVRVVFRTMRDLSILVSMRGGGEQQRTVACDDASHATCSIGLVCDSIIVLRKIVSHIALRLELRQISIIASNSLTSRYNLALLLRPCLFTPASPPEPPSARVQSASSCSPRRRHACRRQAAPRNLGIGPCDLAGSCAGFAALPLAPLAATLPPLPPSATAVPSSPPPPRRRQMAPPVSCSSASVTCRPKPSMLCG